MSRAPKPLTIVEAVRRYAEWGKNTGDLAKGTLQNYAAARGWAERVADTLCDPVPKAALIEARDALLEHVAAISAEKVLTCWQAAWRWCLDRELCIGAWPKLRPLRVRPTRKGPYSDAELADLLAWAVQQDDGAQLLGLTLRTLVETAARAGCWCRRPWRRTSRRLRVGAPRGPG